MSGKKVFVSHAAADSPLVDALVDLLQTGCNLTTEQIFASSVQGVNIPKGVRFEEYIQSQLSDAAVVVVVITPSYWASAFCLCELGAQWMLDLPALPLLVPPQTFGDLKAVANAREAGVIDRAEDLDALRDMIGETLDAKVSTARWGAKRDTFLHALPRLIASIPKAATVSADEHERLAEQAIALQELLAERDADLRAAAERYERLKKAKTAEQVREALKPDEDETVELEQLRRAAQGDLADLPDCVADAIFEVKSGWASEVGWRAEADGWQDAERAAQNSLLIEDSSEQGYWPNQDHPRVKRAEESVTELTEWVPSDLTEAAFIEEHDTLWDTTSREWWQAMGLL